MNIYFARKLRKNPTEAEYRLWWHLQKRRLNGHKFRRQKPIGPFIVDFVCLERMLVIELDGGFHRSMKDYDCERTLRLKEMGYQTLRFWNREVLMNLEVVLEQIERALGPHPTLPLKGEGNGNKS